MGNSGTATGLAATVDPDGGATTYHFEWGETEALGHETRRRSLPGDGSEHSVKELISGLRPGTGYYFRVVATNPAGTTYGRLAEFTADALPGTPAPTPAPSPTPTASPPPAVRPVPPVVSAAAPARPAVARTAPLSRIHLRRAGRGLVVTYRDTRDRPVVVILRRGPHVVGRSRHRSHAGLNRIRWRVLRPGRYVVVLRPSGGPAQTRRVRLRAPR